MEKKIWCLQVKLKLFSNNIICLPLKSISSIILNIIQIQRTIETLDFNVYTKVNHRIILGTIINKKPKIALEYKVYP
jgi:hypothetical protein